MKTTTRTFYQCEICLLEYPRSRPAYNCEAEGMPDKAVEVGDIVEIRYGFGWYDGDKKWVINPKNNRKSEGKKCPKKGTNCFSKCCTMGFYYVITHINKDPDDGHRWRYHIATKSMVKGWADGYTYTSGHYAPKKIENPPKYVVKDSKDLIGEIAKHLY